MEAQIMEILQQSVKHRREGREKSLQLLEFIRAAVIDGRLQPGMKMPSVRALSRSLNLSRGCIQTVLNALLESGLIQEEEDERFIAQASKQPIPSAIPAREVKLSNYAGRLREMKDQLSTSA